MIKRLWNRLFPPRLELAADPQPAPEAPSATLLPDDDSPGHEVPEHFAQAISVLGELAENIIDGTATAFMLVIQNSDGRMYRVNFAARQDADIERISVATMRHGKAMLTAMARLQGNAPTDNRSELDH